MKSAYYYCDAIISHKTTHGVGIMHNYLNGRLLIDMQQMSFHYVLDLINIYLNLILIENHTLILQKTKLAMNLHSTYLLYMEL